MAVWDPRFGLILLFIGWRFELHLLLSILIGYLSNFGISHGPILVYDTCFVFNDNMNATDGSDIVARIGGKCIRAKICCC
ncbi:hypothetical protein VNO77_00214 [Canavalia gladiata]|uniref:Uncharacterized protein n=1 Tax=Canavalia gladiata TaxID=3824 RepID=A0AAN9MPM5_CANGL